MPVLQEAILTETGQLQTTGMFSSDGPTAGSLLFEENTENLAPEIITNSFSDSLLDHEATYECSLDPCAGCVFACRRSPRLLTNGYYLLREDSFLSDEDGTVTLSPSQTSIIYKEKLVRIFRKRKKIRRSLANLFNMGTSKSWLNSTMVESPHGEDTWLEGDSERDENQGYDCGPDDIVLGQSAEISECYRRTPNMPSCSTDVHLQWKRNESRTPSNAKCLDRSKSFTVRKDLFSMIMLTLCLIVYLCVRFFPGKLLPALLHTRY